jgi:hypothetical protein
MKMIRISFAEPSSRPIVLLLVIVASLAVLAISGALVPAAPLYAPGDQPRPIAPLVESTSVPIPITPPTNASSLPVPTAAPAEPSVRVGSSPEPGRQSPVPAASAVPLQPDRLPGLEGNEPAPPYGPRVPGDKYPGFEGAP